ncbi:hypothetical protein KL918_003533 [Ogataea parapolymorpha]|uniref:protein disulfide-isomerase n=1 Tax=Ogataea parapolymorpha (strain ATCC 26012 / BCRC 20466 / JCM 22074 / NRRL Y-7560 / DL-1) TaxID=871575 RepID=W1Q7M3_OGAPD|nr:protein disulfide isomerase family A, member 6 [Ogataea parapolymorpha DL-1]ESW95972.1 protein disulfide isomerase family A, member 6 [Ogataea parapolymorpha DL-1]KAG7866636.1 hypothetical protein KL918_003533 [Ogataea parapolymorpha]KAG7871171.1 hypothetical protein KL916_004359 [Ogataea parapolymorpha]
MFISTVKFAILLFVTATLARVLELDTSNFDDVVLNSDKHTLVKFYASWCSHCSKLEPVWEELATAYEKEPNVQIARIDADKHQKVGKRYGINGYPTIKLFKKDDVQHPIEFEGARSVEAFNNFISAHTGVKPPSSASNLVVKLNDLNIEDVVGGKDAFIAVTAEWCGHCKNLKPIWQKLAEIYQGDSDTVVIGQVQVTDPEPSDWIKEKFQIRSFPTLLYVKNGDLQNPEIYEAPRTLSAFTEFVNERAGTTRAEDGGLHPDAGLLHSLDDLVSTFVGSTKHERVKLANKLTEALNDLKKENKYAKEIRYYSKLVNSLVNGPYDFIPREIARLEKMLGEDLAPEARDSALFRLNILRYFNSCITANTYK